MNPITREEQYLNRLTGEEGIIPDKPVTREEQYFARLCGENNVIPDKPVTRREQYLATLCGEDVITPTKPVTRIEQYMAFASGESESKPENPITREEMYWDKYQGGDVPEEKTIAFTDIITVTDALARAAVDLQTEITATQNFNGYEYPWVGGAGENLLDPNIKFPNEAQFGLTITCADGYNFSYTGTATSSGNIYSTNVSPADAVILPAGTYISKNGTLSLYKANGGWLRNQYSGVEFTIDEPFYVRGIYWEIVEGRTYNINSFIALAKGSTAPSAWTPYENICPISGRTEVNVTRTGKNLLDLSAFEFNDSVYIHSHAPNSDSDAKPLIAFLNAHKGQTFILSGKTTGTPSGVPIGQIRVYKNADNLITITPETALTVPSVNFSEATTVYCYGSTNGASFTDIQIELGSTATEYEPYEGDTFNTELGRTVYGGTLDLTTGELTITHAYVDLGDLTWTTSLSLETPNLFEAYINNKKDGYRNFTTTSYRTVKKLDTMLANGEATGTTITIDEPMAYIFVKDERATTAANFKTLVTGQKMVYELAEPQTVSLTPTEVMMLENNNTIWADSGRVQLTYLSKAAEKVQLMNASLKANTLKLSKGAIKE